MLIRRAEVWGGGVADLRIAGGTITAIGTLEPQTGEEVLDAAGAALLPGLHDHHIHLMASAVRGQSVDCGPPEVTDAASLAVALVQAPGKGWIRGTGYHESVMGLPEAAELDALMPDRPLRIQHRSGRLWLLNSRALDLLLEQAEPSPGLQRRDGRFTGHLFDADDWLRTAIGATPPSLGAVSAELSSFGVTGITDMTPRNDATLAAHFAAEADRGALVQRCLLAGTLDLAEAPASPHWTLGPAKLHLHENALPGFDSSVDFIRTAHRQGRPLASHCTTETELVFTLAALEAAGSLAGDRIEHGGIVRDDHLATMQALGLAVVSQPHFVAERGDQYLADVEPELHPALYRLRLLADAGLTLAAGSDAPFGSTDPWSAMRAAVSRQTRTGQIIGADEALDPENALSLYLADPVDLARQRRIAVGEPADLCLLDRPWTEARGRLNSADVRTTFVAGRIVHKRIDEAPFERRPS